MTLRRVLALALLLIPAGAQGQPTAPTPPGVPPGEATLRGRVVRAADGSAAAGIDVLLYALPAQAPPGVRRGVSGPDGRFAFEGIDHDPATTYLVGAHYQGVSYPGARVGFDANVREQEVEVRIHEVTDESRGTALSALQLRLDWVGNRIEVTEELRVENSGSRTVFVPEDRRATRPPAAELGLPAGVAELSGPLGVLPEGVEVSAGRLSWYGPVFPGGGEVGYQYALPAPQGALRIERALPAAPLRVSVLAPAGGPDLTAPDLSEGEPTVVSGRGYRVFSGEVAGRLALELAVPAARHDPSAVSFAEVRILGELDAAAFEGREEHVIEVAGDGPVIAAGDSPLLTVALPQGASDLRFGSPSSATRLAPLPDGSGIGVMGPLAPGETVLELRYRMPAGKGPFRLERQFAAHVPLLSVYLADTGNLRVRSDTLHRRRAARTPDRNYLYLEAFEVAAGEPVSFTLETRPARAEFPRPALIALVALATGLAAFALAGPLRAAPAAAPAAIPEVESDAQREREALGAALGDLEHDFETGKLDAADYARMNEELHGRVRHLLEIERVAPEPSRDGPPPSPGRACPGCEREVAPEDAFCARCGAKLA
jgi:hypothetical protein